VPQGYPVDFKNTLKTNSYALLGLTASYDVSPQLSLFLDARNLTDKKYAATTDVIA
jgi:iron complex outermembrane receptor protein